MGNGPFKMKGHSLPGPNQASPAKQKLRTRAIDKDGNKVKGAWSKQKNKDKAVSTGLYQSGGGSEGDLVKVTDNRIQDNKKKPGNFKGISFDTWSDAKNGSKRSK